MLFPLELIDLITQYAGEYKVTQEFLSIYSGIEKCHNCFTVPVDITWTCKLIRQINGHDILPDLSLNTMRRLADYPHLANWPVVSAKANLITFLQQHLDKVDWKSLSINPSAICILEKNLDKVDWKLLSANENAIPILEQNLDKVDWSWLSMNINAIDLLERNQDKIDWKWLSTNYKALSLISDNLDKVDWKKFITMLVGCNTMRYNTPNWRDFFSAEKRAIIHQHWYILNKATADYYPSDTRINNYFASLRTAELTMLEW